AGSRRSLGPGHQGLRRDGRRGRSVARHPRGRVLQHAGAVRVRQDHHLADDRRVRGADAGDRLPGGPRRDEPPALPAGREHGVPVLRAVPAPERLRERGVRPSPEEGGQAGHRSPRARGARAQAAQADAARAEADPGGSGDHVHLRDARPGGGDDHVRPPRGHAPRPSRAGRRPRGRVREPADGVRRDLPRGLEPARWGAEGGAGRDLDGSSFGRRRRAPALVPGPVPRRLRGPRGRPAREDPDRGRRGGGASDGPQPGARPASHVHLHRREPPVQGGGPRRGGAHGLGPEPRGARRAPPGCARRPVLATGTHVRGAPAGIRRRGGGGGMSHQDNQLDPALARGLTMPRMSRRELFRYAGVGVGALGLSALLEACGTKGVTSSGSSAQASAGVGSQEWWAKQTLHHQLNFANWPYYIDTAHGKHPSIEQFQQKTGIQVNYTEPIDDNVTFYQSKLRPVLQAGQPTGYDIVVLTNNDWPLSQMMELGWLIPLNHEMMKNFDQYASHLVKDPTWDPGNKYTMAWQSGYTCLGYNTKYVKEPVTSVQILWDEKYAGKIGMFANAGELGSIGLLALGIDPATSTPDDWKKAAD